MSYLIVVCGGIAPDPLQTLEPVAGPALKNEMMLPAVLDPWASHALYEAAHLARQVLGSRVVLVSMSPKAKLQQVLMTVAQRATFELVAVDGPGNGFTDSAAVAEVLAGAIEGIAGLDKSRLILCGGWESATRGSGTTMQMVGERLGITEQFQGVDELRIADDGFEIVERLEGGKRQVSKCSGAPMLLGWATGNLPEPPNQPQIGMANMRVVLPSLQKATRVGAVARPEYRSVTLPSSQRDTQVVKDKSAADIAKELVEWINA